jgi:outer membrane receptor for ferrienterochelin and colicins
MTEVQTNNPDDQDTTGIDAWNARATFSMNNSESKLNYQLGFDLDIETGTGKRILDYEQTIGDYALFGSLKWEPIRKLSVQPGVRLIYNTKYTAPLVYALSAKWMFSDNLFMRVSYSKGFRSPSIKELYLYFVDINHNVQGNPDLGSETSNNINMNLSYNQEMKQSIWTANLSLFYNHVNDIISLAQMTSGTNLYTYINVDQYNAFSGQFGLTYRYCPSLTIEAGLAETGRNYYFDEQESNSDYFFSTDVTASVSYRFLTPDINLSLIYKYTGKTPQFIFGDGTIEEAYVEPYNSLDFTASKGFFENKLKLSAGMKNIFNTTSVQAIGVNGGVHTGGGGESQAIGYGRTVFVKLSVNLNQSK